MMAYAVFFSLELYTVWKVVCKRDYCFDLDGSVHRKHTPFINYNWIKKRVMLSVTKGLTNAGSRQNNVSLMIAVGHQEWKQNWSFLSLVECHSGWQPMSDLGQTPQHRALCHAQMLTGQKRKRKNVVGETVKCHSLCFLFWKKGSHCHTYVIGCHCLITLFLSVLGP